MFITVREGPDRWIRVHDNSGPLLAEIPVPNCCSVSNVKWATEGALLKVVLSSAVQPGTPFYYDMTTGKWNRDAQSVMMVLAGVKYKTEIITAISHDKTEIPLRITHRDDLKPDGQRPVFSLPTAASRARVIWTLATTSRRSNSYGGAGLSPARLFAAGMSMDLSGTHRP